MIKAKRRVRPLICMTVANPPRIKESAPRRRTRVVVFSRAPRVRPSRVSRPSRSRPGRRRVVVSAAASRRSHAAPRRPSVFPRPACRRRRVPSGPRNPVEGGHVRKRRDSRGGDGDRRAAHARRPSGGRATSRRTAAVDAPRTGVQETRAGKVRLRAPGSRGSHAVPARAYADVFLRGRGQRRFEK